MPESPSPRTPLAVLFAAVGLATAIMAAGAVLGFAVRLFRWAAGV